MRCLRAFVCLAVFLSFNLLTLAQPKTPAAVTEDPDKVDARAFAVLFRRVDLFEKMAKAADQAGQPKPHLRRNIPTRFKLSPGDADTLLRFATAWTAETAEINAQGATAVANFHKRFPGGIARKGMDTSPPPELGAIQAHLDSVTLRYRDLLRTAMPETEFQRVQSQVRETFGGTLLSKPAASRNNSDAGVTQ